MPPVSSVLGNCVVGRVGIKASPSAACARGTGCDGLGIELIVWITIDDTLHYPAGMYLISSTISWGPTNLI